MHELEFCRFHDTNYPNNPCATCPSRQPWWPEVEKLIMDKGMEHSATNALLARLDERTMNIESKLNSAIEDKKSFVTKAEFEPVKRIVYGMVALVLVSVFGALLALVLTQ